MYYFFSSLKSVNKLAASNNNFVHFILTMIFIIVISAIFQFKYIKINYNQLL